jgi:hypothetical protein
MTDYEDLIQRLLSWTETGIKDAAVRAEAVNAIRELVVERDDAEEAVSAATDLKQKWRERATKAEAERDMALSAADQLCVKRDEWRERVEKAEADLAAARAALRYFADSLSEFHGEEHHEDGCPDCEAMIEHAAALAAARAEGGE